MKKNLTHLTGIVFLITILIAGACISACNSKEPEAPEIVTIYLKAKKIDGKIHLKMYDSNKPKERVVDKLETLVPPGSTVIWKRSWFSGIKKIEKISSTSGNGNIFKEEAQPIPKSKRFKLEIPKDVSAGEKEKYDIVFVDKDNITSPPIDPYLRIPLTP